jgi:molecular chaperone GrpE
MQALTWLDGIFLIQRKLLAVLQQEGVKEIEAQAGQGFDPNLHEAVAYEGSPDHQEGQIIEVLQKGYMLHDRIIRPALVRVAK